ncbi:MAG TPA: hypothetical protein VEX86_09190 [Longimicrobium sp.]|nr:hypothetical protein [Longimicrobium sp.]
MRYDQGYARGYDRGWTHVGGMGARPRYDQTFRAGGGGYDRGPRGYDAGMRGYDGGMRNGGRYGSHAPWHAGYGATAHPSANQHVDAGETDFLGRPYSAAAQEDVPWGLIEQDRAQGRHSGYDAGYAARDPRGWSRGYDRSGGYATGPRGYDRGGGYGAGPRGYDQGGGYAAGMRHGGSYGGSHGYDRDMRPDQFHARNLPDGDIAGVDANRYARGRDLHYHSNWTRWF